MSGGRFLVALFSFSLLIAAAAVYAHDSKAQDSKSTDKTTVLAEPPKAQAKPVVDI